jgi:hypothetical protein
MRYSVQGFRSRPDEVARAFVIDRRNGSIWKAPSVAVPVTHFETIAPPVVDPLRSHPVVAVAFADVVAADPDMRVMPPLPVIPEARVGYVWAPTKP